MSDYFVKIIPNDPFYHINDEAMGNAAKYLGSILTAESIDIEQYEMPAFVDSGSDLESISCPVCGDEIPFDLWGDYMDSASENGFSELDILTSCCNAKTSLAELKYDFPCGFACSVLIALNPDRIPDDAEIAEIEKLLGTSVRIITAHI